MICCSSESGYSEPVRVQGAFVTDEEVSKIVDFLKTIMKNLNTMTRLHRWSRKIQLKLKKNQNLRGMNILRDAGRFVIESDRAAAGQLQRRFSIGFNRAGRIIDQLHKAGVVGPAEGTKPRKILMSKTSLK